MGTAFSREDPSVSECVVTKISNPPAERNVAHPGERKSFQRAEAKAREVLRERGFNDKQIDAELNRPYRTPLDI